MTIYSLKVPQIYDKKSKKMSETLSKESVLEDSANQTLEDIGQMFSNQLMRLEKGGKQTYDLFKSFEDFDSQDGDKHRFYCKYLKHGCRAALYLQLTDGSKEY
ncbi:hypothetical protein BpHYR1_017494 [Brachionus plicatilis]|uniref:Uncharacterized protein n=1 Tax=Brachionus plicatilis TaxID=10195 RepID=A0A3M7QP11_BRAPC|nr:hypothetical protein BpHYR1_017494 [Brachionus plicatilis]